MHQAAAARPARSGRRVRPRRRRRMRRVLLISLAVVILLVAGLAGYGWYLTHSLHRVNVRGLSQAFTAGKEVGTENILMAGSTTRCGLAVPNPQFGLCSNGVTGVNSDVIMILHADPANHTLALLSIPRDLFIPNARSTGANKVDAGLYQGLSQLVTAIEEDFGIPIQQAVSLNFDQFANIVDALGGINMQFPVSVYDSYSGLNVQAAACDHLDGMQALEVVRARHLQYQAQDSGSDPAYWPQEAQSDLARIERDHEFLRVLATAAAHRGLGNPVSDLDLVNSVKADITFDQSWSVSDMVRLMLDFHSADINSVPQLTLPVSVVDDPEGSGGGLWYKGANYGDVEFPSESQDRAAIDQVLGVGPTIDTLTGKPLPAPSSVTVSVVNGTGLYNQASDTAQELGALGFDTVGTGDQASTGDLAETVVYYGSHSPAAEAAAEAVAGSITGSVVMAYGPAQVLDGAQVTVVTGTQFAVQSPGLSPGAGASAGGGSGSYGASSAGSSGALSAGSASKSSGSSRSTGEIAAPTTATSSLAAWDPRACPAGATATSPVSNRT